MQIFNRDPQSDTGPELRLSPTNDPVDRPPVAFSDASPVEGPPEGSAAIDLSSIGGHIASVLSAAEEAATRIRTEAEQAATNLRESATRFAEGARATAARETETAHAEAQRLVEEAKEAARATAADAEEYAAEQRRQADIQAAATRREGEQRAAALGDVAQNRHAALLADLSATETRVADLAVALHGVALRLEQALGGTSTKPPPAEDSLNSVLAPRAPASDPSATRSG